MTNERLEQAQISIQFTRSTLERIASGQSDADTLSERRDYADWHLCHLLSQLIPVLPCALRAEVQACYDLREQVWSTEYMERYYSEQAEQQMSDSLS